MDAVLMWRSHLRRLTLSVGLLAALCLSAAAPAWAGYSYSRQVTIDKTKVPNTDQTNFPVLFSGTYSYLATVANGGLVTNSSGFDIIFTSDSACATKLDHEIEIYTATSGLVVMWVRVPTVATASNTVIYLCYGNAAITTSQQNVTGVWDSNFLAVYHLKDGSTLSGTDSTNSANGTLVNAPTAAAGQIDGAGSFNNGVTNQNINATISANLGGDFTISAWLKPRTLTDGKLALASEVASYANYYIGIGVGSLQPKAGVNLYDGTLNPSVNSTSSLSVGTWSHVLMRRSTSAARIYIYFNGVNEANAVDTTVSTPGYSAFNIGRQANVVREFDGTIDEVRVSKIGRPDDWITTEYNNQSSPSTFYTLGSQVAFLSGSRSLLGVGQ